MPSPARRLAAIVVLVLSLAIVAFAGLWQLGIPIGIGQLGNPTPLLATPTAEPSSSQDPLSVYAQIEGQVQLLRDLPAADIGAPEIVTRAQLAVTLSGLIDPPLDNASLRAMGLLSANQDIVALTNQLYLAQVLGYYDFNAKRMVLVSDAGLTAEARVTYAHEYTHALQDAAFDSSAAFDAVSGQHDRELALLGLEEGDASVAMVLWAIGHLSADEMKGITQTPLPDMSGIPPWMVTLLEYPYLSGAKFVSQLYASGGWDAVDAVYANPPASTEQVLHPAKYTAHEAPIAVAPLDLLSRLNCENTLSGCPTVRWSLAADSTMGEAWISTWLEGIGVAAGPASAAAAGWGGDRLMVATESDGSWALAWQFAWDTPADATEFETTYAAVERGLGFHTQLVHVSERETVVLQASDYPTIVTMAGLVGS